MRYSRRKSAAHLFLYDRAINKVRPLGRLGDAKGVHHTLVQEADGRVYTSGEDGRVVCYDPALKKLTRTEMQIPGAYYEACWAGRACSELRKSGSDNRHCQRKARDLP